MRKPQKTRSDIYEYLWRTIIQALRSEGLKPNNEFHFALASNDECIHAIDVTVIRHGRRVNLIHTFCLEWILALVLEHDVPIINPTYRALIGQLFFQPRDGQDQVWNQVSVLECYSCYDS